MEQSCGPFRAHATAGFLVASVACGGYSLSQGKLVRRKVKQREAFEDFKPLSPAPLSGGGRGVENEKMKLSLRRRRTGVGKVF